MVLLFYTTYISVDLAHPEVFHAKVGKGDTKPIKLLKMKLRMVVQITMFALWKH